MDNLAEQCEEIEALKSIYDTNWNIETDTNSYSMQVSPNVKLFICLNQGYPSNAPPSFELLAPTLSSQQKQQVSDEFHEIYEYKMLIQSFDVIYVDCLSGATREVQFCSSGLKN
jgi:hypothetical protein